MCYQKWVFKGGIGNFFLTSLFHSVIHLGKEEDLGGISNKSLRHLKGSYQSTLTYVLFSLLILASLASADEVSYFYDDTGRLLRVVKGAEGLSYQYDEVGNLLSINRATIGTSPPVLNSVSPDVLFIGSTTAVTITGQNLFTTKTVISDNSSVIIKTRNITDTEIRAEMTVSPDALAGAIVNITATTLYGSANISATLTSSILSFYPGQIAIAPGNTGSVTASISPPAGQNITITLTNSNPDIASVPAIVTIPSGGITTFNVTAVKDGVTTITSGGSGSTTVVFVEDPFTTLPGETVTNMAGPVSVYIDTPTTANATTPALPVSVYIDSPSENSCTASLPVSVWPQQCSSNPVRMSGSNPIYYLTLQTAYDAANDGDTLQSKALELAGDLNVNDPKSVTLRGGYDCNYVTDEGMTLLNGVLTITDGTLIIENVILE